MNIGQIVRRGVMRADMPINDWNTMRFGLEILNEIIDEHWNHQSYSFKQANFSLTTTANIQEYSLHKYANVPNLIQNSVRGTNPVRNILYQPKQEYYRRYPFVIPTGTSYNFTDGQYQGFQTQVSAESPITLSSSLASITTGTVVVAYGSQQIIFSSSILTLRNLGMWIKVTGDTQEYQITNIISSTKCLIATPYEGTTNGTATYEMGDVHQKACVLGILANGTNVEEEVQLNGATPVVTSNSFAAIVSITKDGPTNGYITATSNGGVITNVILEPGETECNYQTVLFYPIPAISETINYDAYAKHPIMYDWSDSPLFPNEWHPLLVIELTIRLKTEWFKKEVSPEMLRRRDQMLADMISRDNNTDIWKILQETVYESERRLGSNNLPSNYPWNPEN